MFVPLSIWVLYGSAIRGPYSGKVVGVAFGAGALTQVSLFVGYGLYKAEVIGNTGLLVYAACSLLAALSQRFAATRAFHFRPTRFVISELPTESGSFADEEFYNCAHLLFTPAA